MRDMFPVDMGTFLGIIVSITALLMASAPLMQIRKILRERNARDISEALFWIVTLGVGCLAIDTYYTHNLFVAIPNTFSCAMNLTTALLIHRYKPAVEAKPHGT